jgi:hypothetical protein
MAAARGRVCSPSPDTHRHRRPACPVLTHFRGRWGAVVVPYTPDWESLADAPIRVITTSATEDLAKTDLCRAVADHRINVRARVAASDRDIGGAVCSGDWVLVPAHLKLISTGRSRGRANRGRSGHRLGPGLTLILIWKENLAKLISSSLRLPICRRFLDYSNPNPNKTQHPARNRK